MRATTLVAMAVTDSTWTPSSWHEFPALQQPEWPDPAALEALFEEQAQVLSSQLLVSFDVPSGFEQKLQHVGVADFSGQAHRRGAVVVGERHVGAGAQQTPDLGDITLEDRPLQRRAAVGIAAIDVLAPTRRI